MSVIPVNKEIAKNLDAYRRITILLEQLEEAYTSEPFMLKLPNETTRARNTRKSWYETGFVNIAWDLVSSPRDAIFKERVKLQFKNQESSPLALWAQSVDRCTWPIDFKTYLYETVAIGLRAYGTVITIIDRPAGPFESLEEELENGMPYLTNIPPQDVLNWEFGSDGEFIWFAWKYTHQDKWIDPTKPPPKAIEYTKILTKNELLVMQGNVVKKTIPHNFGFVPVVVQDLYIPPNRTCGLIGNSPFFMSSNMIIMGNNMKSIADMELAKFGSTLLLMHEEAMNPYNTETDEEGNSKTKFHDPEQFNTLIWGGQNIPEYLAKDTQAIGLADDKAMSYFMAAIENERSMASAVKKGKTGNDIAQSGIAKIIDATPVMISLVSTSLSMEHYGKKVLNMVSAMLELDTNKYSYELEFPRRFDIAFRALQSSLESIELMIRNQYPSEMGMKEMWKSITDEITHDMDKQTDINNEIDSSKFNLDEEELLELELKRELEEGQIR